jgi:uncharacterized protein (TIGR00730 family)
MKPATLASSRENSWILPADGNTSADSNFVYGLPMSNNEDSAKGLDGREGVDRAGGGSGLDDPMLRSGPHGEIGPTLPPAPPASPQRQRDWGPGRGDTELPDFLAGPRARLTELWRAIRIFGELMRGFRALHFVGPCVTVFGSARFAEDHVYYRMAREVGGRLARLGVTVMTGGGPGIMEAANRGTKEAGGHSIGCNIKLPMEQQPNPYLDKFVEFRYFFVRKVMLVKYSYAFVVLPGGFGTLDELFEALTLVQTRKIESFPIVLMGVEYWAPMIDFIRGTLVHQATIDPQDPDLLTVTDDPAVAIAAVMRGMSMHGRAGRGRPRPIRALGENPV